MWQHTVMREAYAKTGDSGPKSRALLCSMCVMLSATDPVPVRHVPLVEAEEPAVLIVP